MANFNFTDRQWYNFLCGFYAGLRLKDVNAPYYSSNTVLEPIGVGGLGKIGLQMPSFTFSKYGQELIVPISTHDVDIDYSGFSVNVYFDPEVFAFVGATSGEIGDVGLVGSGAPIQYQYYKGVFKAYGLTSNVYKEPKILINVKLKIMQVLHSNVEMVFNNMSQTDVNYTTLLKLVDIEGALYPYFITPLINKNGLVRVIEADVNNNEVPENIVNLTPGGSDSPEVVVQAAPLGIFLGSGSTPPGFRGCIGAYVNFPYNLYNSEMISELRCKILVKDKEVLSNFAITSHIPKHHIVTFSEIERADGVVLDIVIKKDVRFAQNFNFDIEYDVAAGLQDYDIDFDVLSGSALLDDGTLVEMTSALSGRIAYPVESFGENHKVSDIVNTVTGEPEGVVLGALEAKGSIWSDSEQTIEIVVPGTNVKTYIKVEPGWNKIYVKLPIVTDTPKPIKPSIEIKAPGYLLIPAGFNWSVIMPPDSKIVRTNKDIIEKINIADVYDIDIREKPAPVPIDLDGLKDSFEIKDISDLSMRDIVRDGTSLLDSLNFVDVNSVEIKGVTPGPDPGHKDYDLYYLDDVNITDVHVVDVLKVKNSSVDGVEHIHIRDMSELEGNFPMLSPLERVDNMKDSLMFKDRDQVIEKDIRRAQSSQSENLRAHDIYEIEVK